MSFSRAFQWYHSHLDPIWPDGTFNVWNHYFVVNIFDSVKPTKKVTFVVIREQNNKVLSILWIDIMRHF